MPSTNHHHRCRQRQCRRCRRRHSRPLNSSRRSIQSRQRSGSTPSPHEDHHVIIVITDHPDILHNHTTFRIHVNSSVYIFLPQHPH